MFKNLRMTRKICFLSLALIAVSICASRAFADVPALSLEDCLAIAEGHPSVAGAAASVASSRGRLASSVTGDRLKIDGSASAARRYQQNSNESDSYSLGTTASIKLYDANRSKYSVDAARSSLSATEEDALHTLSSVRSNVKTAYLALLLDYEIERQRSDSVAAFEQHLEQAKGFYEAGAKPWYDVTKAEVDLGNAQMSLVEASSNIRNAKASLANAVGIDPSEGFEIERSGLNILSVPDEAINSAEGLAMENRSDYRASALKMDAGRSTLSSEARSNSPTISLSGGYNSSAGDTFNFERGWNTGVSMSIPIVDGGAAKAGVDIAKAQVMTLEASHEKLRQDIMLEVSNARSDITKARERIRISALTLA
ncbi:MAG: TolC family protein, partial [Synergistaceae bacterium]|nr:TolC family protein [Synergistaceae bacterium]